ncbi:hypothetical protein PybrP1_004321, partial [[Pythium] brassicae (nom. inval.)]
MDPQATQQFIENMSQMLAQQQDIINQLLQQRASDGLRVEGLKLPLYSGRLEESAHLFFDQMGHQFFIELDREFVPADLQQRLRDEINNLRQEDCKNLADYIARFRQLNLQIKGMNEIEKIVYFQRGLRQATREEVQYRRCATLGEAIT